MSVVLFVISLNMKISGLRGCQFGKSAMWERRMAYLQFCVYLFVAKKRKQAAREADMKDMCCTTLPCEFGWNLCEVDCTVQRYVINTTLFCRHHEKRKEEEGELEKCKCHWLKKNINTFEFELWLYFESRK